MSDDKLNITPAGAIAACQGIKDLLDESYQYDNDSDATHNLKANIYAIIDRHAQDQATEKPFSTKDELQLECSCGDTIPLKKDDKGEFIGTCLGSSLRYRLIITDCDHTPDDGAMINGCTILKCQFWDGRQCNEPSNVCIYRQSDHIADDGKVDDDLAKANNNLTIAVEKYMYEVIGAIRASVKIEDKKIMAGFYAKDILSMFDYFLAARQTVDVERCLEELADYAHDAWSRWMKHLFGKCILKNVDNFAELKMMIPKEFVDRWQRQLTTDYKNLPEPEKESDRKEARKMLEIITRHIKPYPTEEEIKIMAIKLKGNYQQKAIDELQAENEELKKLLKQNCITQNDLIDDYFKFQAEIKELKAIIKRREDWIDKLQVNNKGAHFTLKMSETTMNKLQAEIKELKEIKVPGLKGIVDSQGDIIGRLQAEIDRLGAYLTKHNWLDIDNETPVTTIIGIIGNFIAENKNYNDIIEHLTEQKDAYKNDLISANKRIVELNAGNRKAMGGSNYGDV